VLNHAPVRILVAGAAAGFLVLGVGGRLAMAAIQVTTTDAPSRWTLGGSVTVILLGAASGLAGAAMALIFRWIAARLPPAYWWLQYVLLSAALVLVTARGLRGTNPVAGWWFYPLVAVYAALMFVIDRRIAGREPARSEP